MDKSKKLQTENYWILICITFTFLFLFIQLSACSANEKYNKTPVSKKVDISVPNIKTEMLVHIGHADNYAFSLIFNYKNREERAHVNALVRGEDAKGNQTNGENTPISIEVYTIKDGENVLVSLGGGDSIPLSSWGSSFKKVIYNDYLMPANYRVVIETKAGNPKFKGIDVELGIGLAHRPK